MYLTQLHYILFAVLLKESCILICYILHCRSSKLYLFIILQNIQSYTELLPRLLAASCIHRPQVIMIDAIDQVNMRPLSILLPMFSLFLFKSVIFICCHYFKTLLDYVFFNEKNLI